MENINLENLKYPNFYDYFQILNFVDYLENLKESIKEGDDLAEQQLTKTIPAGLITKDPVNIKNLFHEKYKNIKDDIKSLYIKRKIKEYEFKDLESRIQNLDHFFEKYY